MNLDDIEELIEVVKIKIIRDQRGTWSQGSMTYFDALFDEIDEVKEELSTGCQCYLEDELGDLLWVYLCLVHNLETEGKVSMSNIYRRASRKYEECSGQLILATDLYSSQYLFSDSLGVSPPL